MSSKTKRAISPALEDILNQDFKVLDHGFIRVVDYMGDESSIVQSARVSYGKGTKSVSKDAALIRYLLRNKHTSPFEMCEIKLHVKLPIFVARQWIRHRTASVNEVSARYSVMDDDYYMPELESIAYQSRTNKQGRGKAFTPQKATDVEFNFRSRPYDYHELLKHGVTRELARIVLPLSKYTEWYWKIDLHNLLHFLELRVAENAQYEIREYANVILQDILRVWLPNVYIAFMDYKVNAFTLSAHALESVKRLVDVEDLEKVDGMTDREYQELIDLLDS